MAIRDTTGERMHDAFVESQNRANKTAVEVFVGNAGDISSGSTNTTASIQNVLFLTANSEQSFSLPNNCKGFVLRPRQVCKLYVAYETSGPYFYAGLGSCFKDTNKYASQTIYFYTDRDNTEIDFITYI